MLQIQLGPEKPVNDLGRTRAGYRPGMTEDEAWDAGRGTWKLKPERALAQDEVQIINTAGTVLAIVAITGISKHGDRYALDGVVQHADPRVGRPTTTPHRSRNSVGYF